MRREPDREHTGKPLARRPAEGRNEVPVSTNRLGLGWAWAGLGGEYAGARERQPARARHRLRRITVAGLAFRRQQRILLPQAGLHEQLWAPV